jgi:hypothetical protein
MSKEANVKIGLLFNFKKMRRVDKNGRVNHAESLLAGQLNDPIFSKHTIGISITRYFTDVDGKILDKTSLAIPNNLKVSYPFWMFGAFDHFGGYQLGNQAAPAHGGSVYLCSFVNGRQTSYSITQFSGFNTIQPKLKIGDIIHVFTDNLTNPTFFIWIVQSCDLTPLASIVANSQSTQQDNRLGQLNIINLKYQTPNVLQWNQAFNFLFPDNIGDYRTDSYQPLVWRTPQSGFTGTIDIKMKFNIDQYLEIYSYILFSTDSINFTFTVEKLATDLPKIPNLK